MRALLCFCLIAISSTAFAQLDNLFYKFDAHAGYALPLGSGYPINGGIAINAEPKVYYNKYLVLGGKLGFNFLNSPASNVKLAPLSTFVLVGEKYTEEDELRFFYGGSAAQTPIDLGVNFPKNTLSVDLYELILYAPTNVNNQIGYRVTRLNTGDKVEGMITAATPGTQLPLSSTFLAHRAWRSNTTIAQAVGLDIASIYISSDQ